MYNFIFKILYRILKEIHDDIKKFLSCIYDQKDICVIIIIVLMIFFGFLLPGIGISIILPINFARNSVSDSVYVTLMIISSCLLSIILIDVGVILSIISVILFREMKHKYLKIKKDLEKDLANNEI